MVMEWAEDGPGVITLPSGRRVRGRALRRPAPVGPEPTLGVYLTGRRPPERDWEMRWIKWRDFWLPSDQASATATLREAWAVSSSGRVEVACGGGVGRTGTALACLCVFDGMPPHDAIHLVREHYEKRAVETPWQRKFVEALGTG